MKAILNNVITKKILIVFITIIMVSNFIMPNYVFATPGDDIITVTFYLFIWLGDGLISLMQRMMMGTWALIDGNTFDIKYSPGVIFADEVPGLKVNFITAESSNGSIAYELQSYIATWYNALRTIALVGLLSVLVYIGIRIILNSTSAENKAKYKNLLKDWLVAICILFMLHYLMALMLNLTESFNNIIKSNVLSSQNGDLLLSTLRTKAKVSASERARSTCCWFCSTVFSSSFTNSNIYNKILKKGCYDGFFNNDSTNGSINIPTR